MERKSEATTQSFEVGRERSEGRDMFDRWVKVDAAIASSPVPTRELCHTSTLCFSLLIREWIPDVPETAFLSKWKSRRGAPCDVKALPLDGATRDV